MGFRPVALEKRVFSILPYQFSGFQLLLLVLGFSVGCFGGEGFWHLYLRCATSSFQVLDTKGGLEASGFRHFVRGGVWLSKFERVFNFLRSKWISHCSTWMWLMNSTRILSYYYHIRISLPYAP